MFYQCGGTQGARGGNGSSGGGVNSGSLIHFTPLSLSLETSLTITHVFSPLFPVLLLSLFWQRGKFFPQLTNLVRINTPKAVQTESRKAFRKLPNLEQGVSTLTNLKGVGTTLASGIDQDRVPPDSLALLAPFSLLLSVAA